MNAMWRCFCLLLLCCILWIASTQAVQVQSISEAREKRAAATAAPSAATTGSGIFGNDSFTFNITNCFLMETTGVGITAQEKTRAVKSLNAELTTNSTTPTVEGECLDSFSNGTATAWVTIAFTDIPSSENLTSATIKMHFTQDHFNWYLMNMTLSATLSPGSTMEGFSDLPLDTKELFGSRGASYYCTNQQDKPFRAYHNSTQVSLFFRDLIMEPFVNDTTLGFDPIENCEYAFSIGIWMGILTALIMGLILGLGISMLASIRNMDRFDDPKTSKLLSVPNE